MEDSNRNQEEYISLRDHLGEIKTTLKCHFIKLNVNNLTNVKKLKLFSKDLVRVQVLH